MLDLADRMAIQDLNSRYCVATDSGRPEEIAALFAEDGVWTGAFGHCEGRQALLEAMTASRELSMTMRHLTLNSIIDGEGDTATGYSYILVLDCSGEQPKPFFTGFYEDEFCKQDGRWLFKRRNIAVSPEPAKVFAS